MECKKIKPWVWVPIKIQNSAIPTLPAENSFRQLDLPTLGLLVLAERIKRPF
jgi:hypothetical protein